MSETATKPELADGVARRDAIFERTRSVVVDAGAGTGKTTLLVERFLELVAPTTDAEPISIDRIAAVTFTRRASGHLRLSIRERVLAELGRTELDKVRRRRLYEVLGGLESAHISTTHSFADRLLRLRPVESRLAPDFQIAADELADGLIDETFETLLHAAETGTLSRWLVGSPAEARAAEAERTLLDAIDAGSSFSRASLSTRQNMVFRAWFAS